MRRDVVACQIVPLRRGSSGGAGSPGLPLAIVVPVHAPAGHRRHLRCWLCACGGGKAARGYPPLPGGRASPECRKGATAPVSAGTAKSPLSCTTADMPELASTSVSSPTAGQGEQR